MKTKLSIFALLTLITLTAQSEQTVLLRVEGIKDKDLYANVRVYLSQISNDEADGSERYQHRVQQAVDKALRALGYYNTQYQFSLTPRPNPQKDLLKLQVQLDKPVKLDERDVQITGMAAEDSDFDNLKKSIPAKETVLNHETYENFKSSVEKLAQARGYFDGQWQVHRLEVYPKDHTADWRLSYDSGIRYKYGNIAFVNSQIRQDYLENILRIKSGDYYHLTDLSKLSSDFSSSNWFTSVLVEPEIHETDKTVDLNVLLQPRKKNDVEIGIGYVTDIGPRLQLNWKKPWLNDRGHSIESNTYISKPEQSFEFGYKIPIKAHPINYFYQFSGGLEREDQNDTKFTGAHLGFQRFWNHETGWAFSLGLKARYDAFEQASQPKIKTLLLYPTASLNRTRSDGNRFPLWGDSQKVTLNWGSKMWGSDVNFYSAKASTAWVRTYFTNHRFYFRAEVGYLNASEFKRITPALRYFAGGDMSVRGFGYKDISPRDDQGKLTGASHLMTASAEYQYQVYPNWWAAAFYDTGLAARHYKGKELHSGAGVGVRWASPIGAIKLDIATPVRSPNNQKGIQFYIGLGSEL
ncbi:autotransporter assembly complex protein TamA [Ursidibacter arcticus]